MRVKYDVRCLMYDREKVNVMNFEIETFMNRYDKIIILNKYC